MIWKPIAKWNNQFEISQDGKVRNLKTGRTLKSMIDYEGYMRQNVSIDNKTKMAYIHRLVAEAFVPNPKPDKFKVVHHINNNRSDNSIDNLMWCDHKYNRAHAYVTCECCGHKIKV